MFNSRFLGSRKAGRRTIREGGREDFEILSREVDIVVVDFYADWCGPCRVMSEVLRRVAEIYPEVGFIKVNVDRNWSWANDLKVRCIPTLLFYRNGRLAYRHVGVFRGSIEETVKIVADIIERLKIYSGQEFEVSEPAENEGKRRPNRPKSSKYVYPRLLQKTAGKWFRIESEEDVLGQIDELLEAFFRTTFRDPLIDPIDTPFDCPFCGEPLYEFYAELPTEYGYAHFIVVYCLNCKKAAVYRSRYIKLHFKRHGILPIPSNQTNLSIFLAKQEVVDTW